MCKSYQLNQTITCKLALVDIYHTVEYVEAYPNFLTWCKGAKVMREQEQVSAKLIVGKGPISACFYTNNTHVHNQQIDINLNTKENNSLGALSGRWNFTEHQTQPGCDIALQLSWNFERKALALVFGEIFEFAFNHMLKAFITQATKYSKLRQQIFYKSTDQPHPTEISVPAHIRAHQLMKYLRACGVISHDIYNEAQFVINDSPCTWQQPIQAGDVLELS